MALPTVKNLEVYSGDDYALEVTVQDADGAVVDVTAYSFSALVKDEAGNTEATATVEKTDASNGLITVRLTDVQTAGLTGPRLLWDLQQTDGNSRVRTILRGVVNVSSDIS